MQKRPRLILETHDALNTEDVFSVLLARSAAGGVRQQVMCSGHSASVLSGGNF